jgi:hypothetical protein
MSTTVTGTFTPFNPFSTFHLHIYHQYLTDIVRHCKVSVKIIVVKEACGIRHAQDAQGMFPKRWDQNGVACRYR